MKLALLPLQNDDVVRVQCDGNVGLESRSPQDDPLRELLGPYCYTLKVLLDLEKVQSVDTTGLTWLIQEHKKFQQAGGKFILYSVPPLVTQVLDFLRLTPHLPIAASEEAAREMALGEPAVVGLRTEPEPEPENGRPIHPAAGRRDEG